MKPKKIPIPEEIDQLRAKLEVWRAAKSGRGRIPESIWDEASNLAHRHGIARVSTPLRLSYESLKRRVAAQSPATTSLPSLTPGAAFVEIGVPALPDQSHCLLEIENEAGCKLKVHLQGSPSFDLVALSKAFLGSRT